MIQHNSPISGIAAFKNKWVATAGYDNQVLLWRAADQTPLQRGLHDHLANQCRFSPCGRYLLSAGSDHTARLWRLPDLKLTRVFSDHQDDVEAAVFHPKKPLVATASRDDHVRVFDWDGNKIRDFEGHTSDVISVEWSPDGRFLISSSDDGTIRKWNVPASTQEEIIDLEGVETDTLVTTPEAILYAGNDAGEIIQIIENRRRNLKAHRSGIKRLIYDASRQALVSLSYDRSLHLYQCAGRDLPALKQTAALPAIVWPRSAAFLGKNKLAFATFGSTYATYDLTSQKWDLTAVQDTFGNNAVLEMDQSLYTVGDAGIVKKDGLAVCAIGTLCNFLVSHGKTVLTGGQMGIVYDALTGREIYQHKSPLNCGTTFSRDGKNYCIIGTYTGEGLVFSPDAGGDIQHVTTLKLYPNAVKGIAAGNNAIFSVCATGAAAFHRIHDFKLSRTIDNAHEKISNGCDALNGKGFASVSRDLKLRLWDLEGNCRVIPTPHKHSIKCVKVSQDGRQIATGSYGGQICIYDRNSQTWIKKMRPTASGISSLAVSSNGKNFWAGSYDGGVYRI